MKLGRLVVAGMTMALVAFAALSLAGCGPTDEEIVRQGVTEELEKIKSLDSDLLDQIASAAGVEQMAAVGIDAKEFVSAYLSGFDYRIENITVNGDSSQVTVVLTCKSYSAFTESLTQAMTELSADESVANMSEDELVDLLGKRVLESISSVEVAQTDPVVLEFAKEDGAWVPTSASEQALAASLFGN